MNHPDIIFSNASKKLLLKVCGMREAANISAISNLEIDMIGFIFYEKSARFIKEDPTNIQQVKSIDNQKTVGVFVNAQIPEVLDKLGTYELDYIQLHGDESPEYCQNLKAVWPEIQIIKAFSVDQNFDFAKTLPYQSTCSLFLFDTKGEKRGGNGIRFDWTLLNNYDGELPFLLSGGIDLEHVEEIKNFRHPKLIGIDLNSRFEFSPGLKDVDKISTFSGNLK